MDRFRNRTEFSLHFCSWCFHFFSSIKIYGTVFLPCSCMMRSDLSICWEREKNFMGNLEYIRLCNHCFHVHGQQSISKNIVGVNAPFETLKCNWISKRNFHAWRKSYWKYSTDLCSLLQQMKSAVYQAGHCWWRTLVETPSLPSPED